MGGLIANTPCVNTKVAVITQSEAMRRHNVYEGHPGNGVWVAGPDCVRTTARDKQSEGTYINCWICKKEAENARLFKIVY